MGYKRTRAVSEVSSMRILALRRGRFIEYSLHFQPPFLNGHMKEWKVALKKGRMEGEEAKQTVAALP